MTLPKDLKDIKLLTKLRRFSEALDACEDLIHSNPDQATEILRHRALIFSLQGDYERAVQDRIPVLESDPNLGDYYLAADNALSASHFELSAKWFKDVLRLGSERKEAWFESAAHFLLAYAEMELRDYDNALASLGQAVTIDPQVKMPIPHLGMRDGHWLELEIKKRKK
jgi:tetratricopeptide (TPR) repeat protein